MPLVDRLDNRRRFHVDEQQTMRDELKVTFNLNTDAELQINIIHYVDQTLLRSQAGLVESS